MAADCTNSLANDAALSPTPLGLQDLPVEVLCHTLSFLPLNDLIIATHVCRSWRAAALAEPNLWTNVSLDGGRRTVPTGGTMRPQFVDRWSYPSFLEDLLLRSRSLPVQLEVLGLDNPYFVVFCQVVRRHMHHIRALRIAHYTNHFIPSEKLPSFALSPTSLRQKGMFGVSLLVAALSTAGPLLEELSVQRSSSPNVTQLPSNFFIHFPKLRTLALGGWVMAPAVASPATSVVEVKVGGLSANYIPWMNLFQHFPSMRELEVIGVGRHLELPLTGLTHTLHRLTIVPDSKDWQFESIRSIALERITHTTIGFPSPTVSRAVLASLGSIDSVELNFSDASEKGIQLLARTAGGATTRELNALCTRVLEEILDGWQTTCLDRVASAVISDRLPWSNVLAALSAMRSLKKLTFLVSARTTKGVFRNQSWDELGGPLLFAESDASTPNLAAACPRLPDLRVLRFRAIDPVLLRTVEPEPDEISLGGMAAHRVSVTLVRQLVSSFYQPLDELVFDGVLLHFRVGSELQDVEALRSLVKDCNL